MQYIVAGKSLENLFKNRSRLLDGIAMCNSGAILKWCLRVICA